MIVCADYFPHKKTEPDFFKSDSFVLCCQYTIKLLFCQVCFMHENQICKSRTTYFISTGLHFIKYTKLILLTRSFCRFDIKNHSLKCTHFIIFHLNDVLLTHRTKLHNKNAQGRFLLPSPYNWYMNIFIYVGKFKLNSAYGCHKYASRASVNVYQALARYSRADKAFCRFFNGKLK